MKPLPRLPFDQIGHAPSGPQARAVTQCLGAGLQTLAQLLQLPSLQPRSATGAAGLAQGLEALLLPRLVPATDGLAMHVQTTGYLRLAEPPIEEVSGFQSASFELVEIAFDASWISHAPTLAQGLPNVTILCETQ